MKTLRTLLLTALGSMLGLWLLVFFFQRSLLFFPTHEPQSEASVAAGLRPWIVDGQQIGYCREVKEPRRVWFHTHGNGGQAANRDFILPCLHSRDSVYILEYPGYGDRPGTPSKASFDEAALQAYEVLVKQHGIERLVVLGESLGSGPACRLAKAPQPPRHIVLVVPFDVLSRVAGGRFPFLPTRLLMRDQWDNIEALRGYTGQLDIFGAKFDTVIPVQHARNLAQSHKNATYHEFEGGHGWADPRLVDLSTVVAPLRYQVLIIPTEEFPYDEAINLVKTISKDTGLDIKLSLPIGTRDWHPYLDRNQYSSDTLTNLAAPVMERLAASYGGDVCILLTLHDLGLHDRSLKFVFSHHDPLRKTSVVSRARMVLTNRAGTLRLS